MLSASLNFVGCEPKKGPERRKPLPNIYTNIPPLVRVLTHLISLVPSERRVFILGANLKNRFGPLSCMPLADGGVARVLWRSPRGPAPRSASRRSLEARASLPLPGRRSQRPLCSYNDVIYTCRDLRTH